MAKADGKPDNWVLTNEFGQVALALDRRGNDIRLSIEDLATGRTILLDAFVLASLVSSSPEDIARHLDPHPPGMDDDDL